MPNAKPFHARYTTARKQFPTQAAALHGRIKRTRTRRRFDSSTHPCFQQRGLDPMTSPRERGLPGRLPTAYFMLATGGGTWIVAVKGERLRERKEERVAPRLRRGSPRQDREFELFKQRITGHPGR